METRAPFVIVGAFVLAAIVAVFGFVYWLNNAGGIGKRETYQVVFNGPVPGLLVGAAVLFNGIRVGEVTSLELVADRPHDVHATIAVAEHTPVRADTKVGLDFQGLTGVPVVALEGGEDAAAPAVQGALVAEKGAGQSMTQAARDALRKVDAVLVGKRRAAARCHRQSQHLYGRAGAQYAEAGRHRRRSGADDRRCDAATQGHLRSAALPTASKRRTLRWSPACASLSRRQRRACRPNASCLPPTRKRMTTLPMRNGAIRLPALVQAKLLQSFENYDIAHAPLRGDALSEGGVRLLIDLRQFDIATAPEPKATIALSAKLIDGTGQLKAARIFEWLKQSIGLVRQCP